MKLDLDQLERIAKKPAPTHPALRDADDFEYLQTFNPETALELIRLARLGQEYRELLDTPTPISPEVVDFLSKEGERSIRQRALAEWAETHGVKALEFYASRHHGLEEIKNPEGPTQEGAKAREALATFPKKS